MYNQYINILREELVTAQGCTEPIAVAFCAAKATKVLGKTPEKIVVSVSGNIIKNVKSVIVPNTNGLKGIEVASIFGAIVGKPEKELEVLADVSDEDRIKASKYINKEDYCCVEHLRTNAKLHMIVKVFAEGEYALVEIINQHTNIIKIEKNNKIIFEDLQNVNNINDGLTDRRCLNVADIIEFANNVEIEKIIDIIERQIDYNTKISDEGLRNKYGANIGKMLIEAYGEDIRVVAKARAAAGSDARMSGCVLPVVINSGSGNQGMTVSLPVIAYAQYIGASKEELIRALALSNLIAIHQKTKVGRLSAYCGAVSAATGSGAGIAWLDGADEEVINKTIINTLANVSGILCDGAKPSCAAKIASAVDAAFMGYELAKKEMVFLSGDGIVKDNVEKTIISVGEIASKGMATTDEEIINIMITN